ncbi:MAG: hypothetical protein NWT12_12385 [Paracoccaceae bacterium]|nr:hypothetical protein [Paracoccaceae bacterium]
MSDPVTNVAIEDVLSSIRRLVSEDARVRPVGLRAEPEVAEVSEPSAGKLVLTPALRVSAPADDEAQDEAQHEEQHEEQQDAPRHDDAVEADLSAVDEDRSEDTQAQDAMHDDLSDALADVDAHPAEAEVSQTGDESAMAWEDHLDDTRDTAPLRLSDALAADIPEALIDTADDAGDAVSEPEIMAFQAGETHDEWTMSSVAPEGEEAMIAEAEDAEDAGASADFVFASSRDAAEHDDATVHAAAYVASDDGEEAAASIFRDDDTILDEESLRELVAEIVRQELQGALGERITRNVRKLVRREIHRALTSHELE